MRRALAFAVLGGTVGVAIACSPSELTLALEEPLALRGGQYFEGAFPGSDAKEGQTPKKPYALSYSTYQTRYRPSSFGITFSGKVTSDATSVAVRLKDRGTGYFVIPAGYPDPADPKFLDGSFAFDLHEVEPGLHTVQIAAIDANGKSGTREEREICVSPYFEDHGNSCDETQSPPAIVIALEWDTPVDLDLRVVTPEGVTLDSKNPTTLVGGKNSGPDSPGTIDVDSNRDCIIDGAQREHLVFEGKPKSGKYRVYADLFDACQEASVNYRVKLYTRVVGKKPGTYGIRESDKGGGTLVSLQQSPDRGIGTWVADITVN